jgi:peptide chain release factor subunit 1
MFAEHDLRELVEFRAPAPVLSVYLNTDPTQGNADAHKLRVRSMLKDINLPQDIEVIQRYLDHEYNWSGRGVALFSCAQEKFLRVYSLAVPVRSLIHIGDRPSVKILADLLDSYGGYGVILVDKQGARVFHFHMGALVEQEGVVGEEIKHTKRGGASSMPGRMGGVAGQTRFVEEQIDRNMRESAAFAVHFFEDKHIRRILIGGTDENINLFRSHLPKASQSLIVGTFHASMTATHGEVQDKAMQVGREAGARMEATLIERLITNAAKGSGGVVGLAAVLDAVNTGRVQTLVLAEGFRKVGFHHKEEGTLTLAVPESDGREHNFEKVFDVVELAVGATIRSGGEIEVVHQNEALEKAGNIGALLRY